MIKKKGEYTLWSLSAIGAIYTDKKGNMYVYDSGRMTLTNLKTHKVTKVIEKVI